MTAHRLFVLFIAAYFVAAGIGAIALGIDIFSSSPILGEDGRPAAVQFILLGAGLIGLAAEGIKINFFAKTPATAAPTTT